MKTNSKHHLRWKLLIYPRFQVPLILMNLAIVLVGLVLVALQLRYTTESLRQLGTAAQIPEGHAYYRYLDWQLHRFYSHLLVVFGVILGISVPILLFLSHRLAGPIMRLKSYFASLGVDGREEPEPIAFRKSDFFDDLPEVINAAVKRLRQRP